MSKNRIYHYYVEGEDEKKIVDTLKSQMGCICSGKVDVFNVVQHKLSLGKIRILKPETTVVLVYDTDVETNMEIIEYNIEFLRKQSCVKEILCIPQVNNLDDELKRSCGVKSVHEIIKSTSKKEYKHQLIRCTNLDRRLVSSNFKIEHFWNQMPQNRFKKFGNDARKIKMMKKLHTLL